MMEQDMDVKDEAKKQGLKELIMKMYEMMAKDEEEQGVAMEDGQGGSDEAMIAEDAGSGSLMEKAMATDEGEIMPDDLNMAEVKEFLTKKKKMPVGKSLNIMAITKSPVPKFNAPKMKKYG